MFFKKSVVVVVFVENLFCRCRRDRASVRLMLGVESYLHNVVHKYEWAE